MWSTFLNVTVNLRRPGYLSVIFTKISGRLRVFLRLAEAEVSSRNWCEANVSDDDAWARSLDSALWEEALVFASDHREYAASVLQKLDVKLGGGGHYALLYFLVRYFKPNNVLETGVAAGHSSRSILSAMAVNGYGHLYSSDFPYFRLKDPEKFIGVLVEDEIRSRWTLGIKGDEVNLPPLLAAAPSIDLFHYDSDKTKKGRQWALNVVRKKLSQSHIIIFDDIQDNDHFQLLVQNEQDKAFVFRFGNKFLGVLVNMDISSA